MLSSREMMLAWSSTMRRGKKKITKNVIAYEGLRKVDYIYKKESLKGVSPVALGDGPQWVKAQAEASM